MTMTTLNVRSNFNQLALRSHASTNRAHNFTGALRSFSQYSLTLSLGFYDRKQQVLLSERSKHVVEAKKKRKTRFLSAVE
jgi:hypothetical protein